MHDPKPSESLANDAARANVARVRDRIQAACAEAERNPDHVTLIAVSKTKPAAAVRAVAASGVEHFGENYLAEAEEKIAECRDLDLTWHFIGRIQSNKTQSIARHFDWVHTVDRLKIASRLAKQCTPGKSLNVLLQVNIDRDTAKAGVLVENAPELLSQVTELPNLQLRGLMTILSQAADPGASYQSMAQLFATLRQQLRPEHAAHWDTLSMGMTGDLEPAVAAGATQVRVGTALFGPRDPR